jgi:hypothetical protein
MSTKTASLRIEELKDALRKEEAALAATITLSGELAAARLAENDFSCQMRVNLQNIAEATEGLEFLRKTRNSTPHQVQKRFLLDTQVQIEEENIRSLTVKGRELEQKLGQAKIARLAIEQRITEHPVYIAIRTRQRELIEQAAKVVESFFETTLDKWHRLMEIVSELDRSESNLIADAIPQLSAAGLPDVGPILRSFFQQAVPHSILQQIPHERSRAFREVQKLRDLKSR